MSKTSQLSPSGQLYEQACRVLPGGISRNTIFRTPHPDYVHSAQGCLVTDIDGVTRIDFSNNMCSLIHGHSHPAIVAATVEQMQKGTAFTMATEMELRFAQHLCSRSCGLEMIRFVNSGTEAMMSAIKAARAITGKPKIAKTEGAYHGTYDYAEVSQMSNPANWGPAERPASVPVARGTPQAALNDVVVFPFNEIDITLDLLQENKNTLAAVVLDLLPHRVGLIPASDAFVRAIGDWTKANDCLLIFDEVITFRMEYGGAQQWFDVIPDLTALGKIIGGGFPVGALAGKQEWMAVLDPSRESLPFPLSGTFSANPITMTAGMAAMKAFDQNAVDRINDLGGYARRRLADAIQHSKAEACVTGAGSMFRVHLKEKPPGEYRSAYQDADETKQLRKLVEGLYQRGFILINTCSGALSTAMGKQEIDRLADALEETLRAGE